MPVARATRLSSDSAGITPELGSCFRGNDFDRGDLGRGRAHRVLDRQLQRHRRRRTALAAARNCRRTTSSSHPEQRHVSAVRPEIGPHAVQRVGRPVARRRADAARAPAAGWRRGRRRRTGPRGPGSAANATSIIRSSTGAVEVGHLTDELLGAFARDGAARLRWRRAGSVFDRPPCATARRPRVPPGLAVSAGPYAIPRLRIGSGSAVAPVSSPCRGTCAPRTADTGRNCAPCA